MILYQDICLSKTSTALSPGSSQTSVLGEYHSNFALCLEYACLIHLYRMYYAYAAPHEKMAWDARMEPKVVDIFEKLWSTNELLCSFDGLNISLPNRKDISWSPWPHCDQNPERKG